MILFLIILVSSTVMQFPLMAMAEERYRLCQAIEGSKTIDEFRKKYHEIIPAYIRIDERLKTQLFTEIDLWGWTNPQSRALARDDAVSLEILQCMKEQGAQFVQRTLNHYLGSAEVYKHTDQIRAQKIAFLVSCGTSASSALESYFLYSVKFCDRLPNKHIVRTLIANKANPSVALHPIVSARSYRCSYGPMLQEHHSEWAAVCTLLGYKDEAAKHEQHLKEYDALLLKRKQDEEMRQQEATKACEKYAYAQQQDVLANRLKRAIKQGNRVAVEGIMADIDMPVSYNLCDLEGAKTWADFAQQQVVAPASRICGGQEAFARRKEQQGAIVALLTDKQSVAGQQAGNDV